MLILGINSYHPDSSAAVIIDGRLVAACEEERFRRIKHFSGFPSESIRYCLKEAGLSVKDVDYIAIPRDAKARILTKALYGLMVPSLAKHRLSAWHMTFSLKERLSRFFGVGPDKIKAEVISVEHHRAHLASSFYASGLEEAFLFSADALGDFASTMWAVGKGGRIRVLGETAFPHSLGFYYTAITQYLGFLDFGDEYKVMGLSSYGQPAYEDEFKKILKIKGDRFRLGLEYFLHHNRYIEMSFKDQYPKVDRIFSPYLEKRLGKARGPGQPLEKRHRDIARSLQNRLEETIFCLVNALCPKALTGLCLSGGVSHNCAVNGKLFDHTHFKEIYVPPAPGDAGLAQGAAFYLWHQILEKPRGLEIRHAYFGPGYEEADFRRRVDELVKAGCTIEKIEDEDKLAERTALEISEGKIVGWFQGRMELGPRALGNRSILADPRKENARAILNQRIKQRESFRPFAPSILEEETAQYFEHLHPSPFMSFVYKIKPDKREAIPAVCHVDQTARLQTVSKEANPLYWKLIDKFRAITGIPVLLNTSFNENEPIVCSPEEAADCFLRTRMDILVMGPYIVRKFTRAKKLIKKISVSG